VTGLTPVSFKKRREHLPRLSSPYVPGRTHERYWREDELQVLRDHFPNGGGRACMAHLPNRSLSTIYQQAHKLGLKSAVQVAKQPRVPAPANIDERILAAWPDLSGKGAVTRFAEELGVPRHQVSQRALKLGLTLPHKKEPPWTDAENALMRNVPLHNPDRCAEIFREHGFTRTATAIVVRAKRLNISRRTHETLSATAAANILGVDQKWVTSRCIAGELKASRRGSSRLPQQGGDAWAIKPVDLRAFVLEHLAHVDIRKVEKFAFVQLLVGQTAEPA
jgi:hypothetical protein